MVHPGMPTTSAVAPPISRVRPITVIRPPAFAQVRPLADLVRLLHFTDLLRTLSAHRIRVRYKQSRLGIAWAMLHPMAMMLVFTAMFALLGTTQADGVPYALFAFAGLLPWSAFSSGLASTTTSLTAHAALLTKVYFPREILPVTYVIAALVDFFIGALVLGALMVFYAVTPTATALWAIVAVAVLAAALTGTGLLTSALQVRHRDVGLAMPVLLQVWMFASPIVYPLSLVQAKLSGPLYWLYLLNPVAGIVDTFRRGLVFGQAPDPLALGMSAAVSIVLLPCAYMYFKYTERLMADVV